MFCFLLLEININTVFFICCCLFIYACVAGLSLSVPPPHKTKKKRQAWAREMAWWGQGLPHKMASILSTHRKVSSGTHL